MLQGGRWPLVLADGRLVGLYTLGRRWARVCLLPIFCPFNRLECGTTYQVQLRPVVQSGVYLTMHMQWSSLESTWLCMPMTPTLSFTAPAARLVPATPTVRMGERTRPVEKR